MIYKYYGKITDIFLSEIGLQGKQAVLPVDAFRVFAVRNNFDIDHVDDALQLQELETDLIQRFDFIELLIYLSRMKYKEATKTYVALDKLMKDDVFKSEFDRIRFRHEQCYTHEVI